ncbi:MAG: FHA domain-containing protein [Nitrospiraceae bacterium]|nr:FHA domain-containing protein [Nitrospiraceae bacterium]
MIKELFPHGDSIFTDRPYSPEFFALAIDEIDKAASFIGLIRVDAKDAAYLLFFLKGSVYAAGCISGNKTLPLSIKEFLQYVNSDNDSKKISLYKTDPVLLKAMLVFIQKEPSTKVTAEMIHLDEFIEQIKEAKSDIFLILRKNNMYNFFYFHAGEPKTVNFADSFWIGWEQRDIPLAEQIMIYAYPADKTPVQVLVYRDIKTEEADDLSELKLFQTALNIASKSSEKPYVQPEVKANKETKPLRIRLEITEGPQKGNKFNIPLPFTIGRREADVRIRDMSISKRHALFETSEGKIIYKDLDSTNGSIINGTSVKEKVLNDGDIIQMGNTTLTIHVVSD